MQQEKPQTSNSFKSFQLTFICDLLWWLRVTRRMPEHFPDHTPLPHAPLASLRRTRCHTETRCLDRILGCRLCWAHLYMGTHVGKGCRFSYQRREATLAMKDPSPLARGGEASIKRVVGSCHQWEGRNIHSGSTGAALTNSQMNVECS